MCREENVNGENEQIILDINIEDVEEELSEELIDLKQRIRDAECNYLSNITDDDRLEIERIEKNYLDSINYLLSMDVDKMIKGLNSKDSIRDDWRAFLSTSTKAKRSELSTGAERIFYWLFNQFGAPNSSPIGSDLFFETHDAYIHIDIKSVQSKNKGDFKGKVAIERNQTSYKSTFLVNEGKANQERRSYQGNLPYFYTKESGKKKVCLTYFIAVFYDADNYEIEWIKLVCMPNGLLQGIYGEDILSAGKNTTPPKIRYAYEKNNTFNMLSEQPSRVKVLYWNENMDAKLQSYFSYLKEVYENREEL